MYESIKSDIDEVFDQYSLVLRPTHLPQRTVSVIEVLSHILRYVTPLWYLFDNCFNKTTNTDIDNNVDNFFEAISRDKIKVPSHSFIVVPITESKVEFLGLTIDHCKHVFRKFIERPATPCVHIFIVAFTSSLCTLSSLQQLVLVAFN